MSWLEKTKNALFGGEAAPVGDVAGRSEESDPPPNTGVAAAIADKIVELSSDGLSVENLDHSGHLFDYGYLDSLSAVSLIGYVEDTWQVEISESDLIGSLDCISALSRHIEAERASR